MSTDACERNKETVRRLVAARNAHETGGLDELIHAEWSLSNPTIALVLRGPAAMAEAYDRAKAAFPDSVMTIDDLIAEGDKVVTRYTWRATHQVDHNARSGPLSRQASDPPDGRALHFTGMVIDRFEDGKVIETWENQDMLGLMQQLGAAAI